MNVKWYSVILAIFLALSSATFPLNQAEAAPASASTTEQGRETAYHCSTNMVVWSGNSAIYFQASAWCPHEHSGTLSAQNLVVNAAKTDWVLVPANGSRYVTRVAYCNPGAQYAVQGRSVFSAGGNTIMQTDPVIYIWCQY